MINLFQQREFGDKINITFQYITQNFRSLLMALLYIVGPLALVTGIATGVFQSNILALTESSQINSGATDPMAVLSIFKNIFSPAFWIVVVFGILTALAVNLVTYTHMKLYAAKSSGDISVSEVWEAMQPAIGRSLVITILGSIITSIAFIFFFIPGIYVGVVLSLGLAVTVFEGTDFGQTWSRCFQLIRDKWWSTFGLIVVMSIIAAIVSLVFGIPAGIINFLAAAKLLPAASGVWLVVGNVVSTVGGSLVRALLFVAVGFQYTNLVERQEGRGLSSAIDSIGTTPTKPRLDDEGEY